MCTPSELRLLPVFGSDEEFRYKRPLRIVQRAAREGNFRNSSLLVGVERISGSLDSYRSRTGRRQMALPSLERLLRSVGVIGARVR